MNAFAAGTRLSWTVDLKTAAIWGVLAALSAVAVLPYLMLHVLAPLFATVSTS